MQKIPLLVVAGPTASGKTALGIKLAEKLGGEIVSADSMQIYRGIPIATAQPSSEQLSAVPHRLIGFLDVGTPFSVADYAELAHGELADIYSKGKLPIMVGGTGLYIDTVVDDITLSDCGNTEIRKQLEAELSKNGIDKLYERLQQVDPAAAEKINKENTRRVIRALEVFLATGTPFSRHNELSRAKPSRYNCLYLRLDFSERELLYNRINTRVDEMLSLGLEVEAAEYRAKMCESGAGQAIGHKELYPYLDGEISLAEAAENLKRATRRYAKRQQTWFSRREDAVSLNGAENPFDEALAAYNDWRNEK